MIPSTFYDHGKRPGEQLPGGALMVGHVRELPALVELP
jgi:hypothetical protein